MTFDYQPVLKSDLVELRPLRAEDYDDLFTIAQDPLIWAQHPVKNRHEQASFRQFFSKALTSGGTLVAIDSKTGQTIGSSRFHAHDSEKSEVEIGWTFPASQGLTERNPASHAIWVVAGITLVALAVMVGIEIFDWLRERVRNRRAGIDAPEAELGGFGLREPDTELHHRYEQKLPKVASREQKANEPVDRLR